MVDFWLKLFVVYFMVGTMFLMMFITGQLHLTMTSKKDRKRIERYQNVHILLLPVVAIIDILANKRSKGGAK